MERITGAAIALNVSDPGASASFLEGSFGFRRTKSADGFVALSRSDAGFDVMFVRTGLPSFKPDAMAGHGADGVLVALVVEDVDAEYERVKAAGIEITTELLTEPWGERFFQVTDPCGVVFHILTWVDGSAAA